jgi:hypothetical protein
MLDNVTDVVSPEQDDCFQVICGDRRTFDLRSTESKADSESWMDAILRQRNAHDQHQRTLQYQARQAEEEAKRREEQFAAMSNVATASTLSPKVQSAAANSYFTQLASSKSSSGKQSGSHARSSSVSIPSPVVAVSTPAQVVSPVPLASPAAPISDSYSESDSDADVPPPPQDDDSPPPSPPPELATLPPIPGTLIS